MRFSLVLEHHLQMLLTSAGSSRVLIHGLLDSWWAGHLLTLLLSNCRWTGHLLALLLHRSKVRRPPADTAAACTAGGQRRHRPTWHAGTRPMLRLQRWRPPSKPRWNRLRPLRQLRMPTSSPWRSGMGSSSAGTLRHPSSCHRYGAHRQLGTAGCWSGPWGMQTGDGSSALWPGSCHGGCIDTTWLWCLPISHVPVPVKESEAALQTLWGWGS